MTNCHQDENQKIQITPEAQQSISSLGIVFFRMFKRRREFWEDSVITKRVGKVMYIILNAKWEYKRHLNLLRPRFTEDVIAQEEVLIDVLYDAFDIPTPTPGMAVPRQSNKRKKKWVEPLRKNKKY